MSSLGDSTLFGSLVPGGAPDASVAGGIDTQQVIDRLLPDLHADSRDDLTFWAESDLIQWMDEAVKRLATLACVFAGRDGTAETVPFQAAYPLPPQHIATLHVSYGTAPLRPSNALELEARDTAFAVTSGTPDAWYEDRLPDLTIAIARLPVDAQSLPVIYEGWPDALDTGKQNTLVAAPAPLKYYLAMCVLAEAYGREGESEMPDVASHCREQATVFEQMMQFYYGAGM